MKTVCVLTNKGFNQNLHNNNVVRNILYFNLSHCPCITTIWPIGNTNSQSQKTDIIKIFGPWNPTV